MTYLSRSRTWREVAATLWLMLLAAGLLATSDIHDGGGGGGVTWSGSGPNVTLSPADPARAFAVRLVMPNLVAAAEGSETAWSLPFTASVTLRVGSRLGDSSSMGSGGEGGESGATTASAGVPWPWITARLKDASGISLSESTPFLTEWVGGAAVVFSGNCAAPDPEGVNPCVASFTVEFEREPGLTHGTSEISWNVEASMYLPGFEDEPLTATVKIQPL